MPAQNGERFLVEVALEPLLEVRELPPVEALDHAFPETVDLQDQSGAVTIRLRNDGTCLTVTVEDDGVGVPEGFDLDAQTGLGLSIVRTLVTSELNGTISMRRGSGTGERAGTVVEIDVPGLRPT